MTEQAATTEENVDLFTTNKGKEVEIVTDSTGLWYATMQGQLPNELSGKWTTRDRAEYAVEHWLSNQKPARTGDPDYKPKGRRSKKK